MNATALFLTGLGLTLVAGLSVAIYLRGHLARLLTDLCGTVERGAFWTAFSNITLVLVPLIAAFHRRPEAGEDALVQLSTQLEWALGGLAGAVLVLGAVISRFIPRPLLPATRAHAPLHAARAPETAGPGEAALRS